MFLKYILSVSRVFHMDLNLQDLLQIYANDFILERY